jgi:two-component system, OmpR family, sensor kinase
VNLSVRRLPIRTRLALIYTGLLVAALAIFGTGTFLVLRVQLQSSLDAGLMANAHHAAGAFAQDIGADGQLHPTARLLDQFAATGGRVEILDSAGKLVLDSSPAGTAPLPIPTSDIFPGAHPQDVHPAIAGGESYRLVVEPISAQGQGVAGYVVWAASTRDMDDLLRTVALVLVLGGLLLTALAFGAGWLLARRALAPIADVTDTARAISLSGDFGARVEVAGPGGDEVSELAVAFNEMLGALEENHQALQRFLGDASHELRTPLTTLRASLDLVARPALPTEERAALVADARAETERMARLVSDLLSLARAESGARLAVEPVELDAVLLEAVRQAGPAAPHVRMEVGSIEPVVVQGDRDRLKELLLIVLDNAGRYTPAGGKVTASLRREGQDACVDVSDTGVGIPESERPHVFERLYRGSAARSLRPAGTGLGLAIARWIVDAHAGSIDVSPAQPHGTVVSISLPASNR